MRPEWKDRLKIWIEMLQKEFYEPIGEIPLEGFCTFDMLDPADAEKAAGYAPMPAGTRWGLTGEYCWMRGDIVLPEKAAGHRIVIDLRAGGEATVFINGEAFGTRRAEWVKVPHHYICDQIITHSGKPGEKFHLLMEAYAGHDFPDRGGCATGPLREGENDYPGVPEGQTRHTVVASTFGIWHEEAYQLWLDVTALGDLLSVTEDTSLRAAKIEEALENFTLAVDFEQPREKRIQDYIKARELLRPAMEAKNGSTAPMFTAVGNAHIDLSWLWNYRETQRKVARTFAAQIRLMDMYPEYRYVQSQPQAYEICKKLYPKLYERMREKIASGQWIADGGMWVEPDTNMPSGEALVRQLLYGKLYYQKEFGVDCQMLWLPDTFGYSAALPQLLRGVGMKYLTTQKIFWTYNGSDRFPYHYFTWQGMDGSEVTSFLHMDYTSHTETSTVVNRWRDRVQKRDMDRFLLPFGYGDGGGGPTRDDIEYVLREKNLEGVPQVKMDAPQHFFEESAEAGAPKNRYVGELYFQCHRGTYTSQAATKKNNRKSEIALRDAEIWSVGSGVPYPAETLDAAWKNVLLNQFHDILPGSSIAPVYVEAGERYKEVFASAKAMTDAALSAIAKGQGKTWFNSLSWERKALVKTESGYGQVVIPPYGWSGQVSTSLPQNPVSAQMTPRGVTLTNGLVCLRVDARGEIDAFTDQKGHSRIGGKGNVLKLYKDVPRVFDAWDIDSNYDLLPVELPAPDSVELTEETPFRCAVTVKRRLTEKSSLTQQIVLEAGSARVDFITHVSWHDHHRLLKAAFSTGVHAEEAIHEIQYGYVNRPTHRSRPYDADRFEVCNHRYTALCDGLRGAAVLNDCKYGVSALGDEIALTLLRGATSPDPQADQGEHDFTYSYYVFDGPFAQSDVVRQGLELNVPVREAAGSADAGSLLSIDAKNVIVDALKEAEDGSGDLILRMYEAQHAACDAALTLNIPHKAVFFANLMEQEDGQAREVDGVIPLTFRAFEVKTLRIHR